MLTVKEIVNPHNSLESPRQSKESGRPMVSSGGLFREIFVNNLNNLEEDDAAAVSQQPTVDLVIRFDIE